MAGKFSVEAVFKATDRFTKPMVRMQSRFSRQIKKMQVQVKAFGRNVGKVAKSLGGLGGSMAKFGAGSAALFGTAITLTNRNTVEQERLTKAVKGNIQVMEALTAAAKPAGFEFENVNSLMEEMNNKLGESAGLEQITAVKESMKILGLQFTKIKKLAPEKQFNKILNSALAMKDEQKAASALDILLGGEANRLLGVFKQQGGSIEEIVKAYQKMNLQTDASRRGARRFTDAFNQTTIAFASFAKEASGLAGEALAPLLEEFNEWISVQENKKLVQTKTKETFEAMADAIKSFSKWIKDPETSKKFDGMLSTAKELVPTLQDMAKALTAIVDAGKILASPITKTGEILGTGAAMAVTGSERMIRRAGGTANVAAAQGSMFGGPIMPISSPQERIVRSVQENNNNSKVELVVKDETGRAEMRGKNDSILTTIERSGAF